MNNSGLSKGFHHSFLSSVAAHSYTCIYWLIYGEGEGLISLSKCGYNIRYKNLV